MDTKTDDFNLLTDLQKHLANAGTLLDKAQAELEEVNFSFNLTIQDQDRVDNPTAKALESTMKAVEQTNEALAWCCWLKFNITPEEKEPY